MRFAKQRLLAEAGLVEPPEGLLAGIPVGALSGSQPGRSRIAIPVGPVIKDPETGRPNQMKMHGSVLSVSPLARLGYSDSLPLPAVQHLLENPNAQMASVSFGWDGDWGYTGPKGEGAMEAAKVGYRDLLKKAYQDLAGELSLKPGDMLSNSPIGASSGDYRRAMSYMNYGNYGPLDLRREMTATISPTGQMMPMLMEPINERFAERLGWKPGALQPLPGEMVQEIQKLAQQKVAARSKGLFGGGKGRSQDGSTRGSGRDPDEFDEWSDFDMPDAWVERFTGVARQRRDQDEQRMDDDPRINDLSLRESDHWDNTLYPPPSDAYYPDPDVPPQGEYLGSALQEEGLLGNNRYPGLQEEGLLRNSAGRTAGLTPVQGRTMDMMRRYGWNGGAEADDIERWNGLVGGAMRSSGARHPDELGDNRLRAITEDVYVIRRGLQDGSIPF